MLYGFRELGTVRRIFFFFASLVSSRHAHASDDSKMIHMGWLNIKLQILLIQLNNSSWEIIPDSIPQK